MAKVTGGEVMAAMLAAEGVDTVFGIIDGTYFGFYSALERHGIRLVSPRHETSALHMAGAYARLTGRVGVAMASNGPGVANALPGVAVEQGEGNRVLLLTSARRTGISYPERGGTFQYFDQVGVIGPMSKQSQAVPSHERLPEMLRRAFRATWEGRPGVVHVDVPEDLINGESPLDLGTEVRPPATYRRVDPIEPSEAMVRRVADALRSAERPLIHAGTGVVHADAHDALQAVASLTGAPVITSWGGRGALVESGNHLAVPMSHLDLYTRLRTEADVVLVLGSRIGETDWWGKPPYWGRPGEQTIIQVDVDDATLGGTRPIDLAVLADIGPFLARLRDDLMSHPPTPRPDTWSAERTSDRAKLDKRLEKSTDAVNPAWVPIRAAQAFGEDAIWVFDGGNSTVWSHFFHETTHPNSLLTTFKFGMLGAGVAQALGAQVAAPDRRVVCLIGDGAMGFHPQEVETAVRNELPVVWVVFVDRQWGMVKMNQQFALKPLKTVVRKSLSEDETINADFAEIRFDDLARSMGAHGVRVSTNDGLADALAEARDVGGPAVVHVDVDPVAHMWAPALRAFKDMHGEPGG
ncbi:MAG: thiamine pyrophosphate-binding protein [Acidimicrobiia bacterium]